MKRKRLVLLSIGIWCLSLSTFTILPSCKKENVEEKFYSEPGPGKEYYLNNIQPILNNKCFSCHNYHNAPGNKYDTYSKAAGIAEEMANRIHATNAGIMPPISSAPLSEEEKEKFKVFYELVKGGSVSQEYKVSVSWTAYKFPDSLNRVGVTGTFDDVFINYNNKDARDIYGYLHGTEAIINSSSVNINNDQEKKMNLQNYFFSIFSPVIYCKVITMDSTAKKATINITMNGISKDVSFDIKEQGEDLIFTGGINNITIFNSQAAIDSLQKICGSYHKNKLWPDISLKAEIKNYKNFIMH